MVLRRQILMLGLARSQGSCWLLERTGIAAPDNRVRQPPDKLKLLPHMVEAGCHFVIGLSARRVSRRRDPSYNREMVDLRRAHRSRRSIKLKRALPLPLP